MQVKIIERQKQIELEEKEIQRRERQYDSEVKRKQMRTVMLLSSRLRRKSEASCRSRCEEIQH